MVISIQPDGRRILNPGKRELAAAICVMLRTDEWWRVEKDRTQAAPLDRLMTIESATKYLNGAQDRWEKMRFRAELVPSNLEDWREGNG